MVTAAAVNSGASIPTTAKKQRGKSGGTGTGTGGTSRTPRRATATISAINGKRTSESLANLAMHALRSLLAGNGSVYISESIDHEDHPDYSVTWMPGNDGRESAVRMRPQHFQRGTMETALLAAAGMEPEKWCPACESMKLVSAFRCNKSRGDGLESACLECSRRMSEANYKKYKEKKIAAAVEAGQELPSAERGRAKFNPPIARRATTEEGGASESGAGPGASAAE